jgi:hypothetical protein
VPKLLTHPLSEIEQFWVDDWRWHINRFEREFHSYASGSVLLQLRALRDYIANNKRGNVSYRDQVLSALLEFKKDDFVKASPVFYTDLRNLCAEVKSNVTAHSRRLLDQMLEGFPSAELGVWLADRLRQRLSGFCKEDGLEAVSIVNGQLITHLFALGFGWSFIGDVPKAVLSSDLVLHDGTIVTRIPGFPFALDDNPSGVAAARRRNRNAALFLNDLQNIDRIARVRSYFLLKETARRFIFEVQGAKGTVDLHIGSVHFYSPWIKRYVPWQAEAFASKAETFHDEGHSGVNSSVVVSSVEAAGGAEKAAMEIESALNVLKLAINSNVPLRIDKDQQLVLDIDGNMLHAARGTSEALIREVYTPNLEFMRPQSREKAERVGTLLSKAPSDSAAHKKIAVSIQAYRKVCEAIRPEDRLSDAWTILEVLFSFGEKAVSDSSDGIENVIGPMMAAIEVRRSIVLAVKELFSELESTLFLDEHRLHGVAAFPASEELKRGLGLRPSEPFDIRRFFSVLDEAARVATTYHLRRRINVVKQLLCCARKQANYLDEFQNRVKREVRAIYQLRNQIVHNAFIQHETIAPYAQRCESLATLALWVACEATAPDKIDERILDEYAAGQRLLSILDKANPQSVDIMASEVFGGVGNY